MMHDALIRPAGLREIFYSGRDLSPGFLELKEQVLIPLFLSCNNKERDKEIWRQRDMEVGPWSR